MPSAAFVHDRITVASGDAQLHLEVRGSRKAAPVVLFLHGGPGSIAHLVMFESTVGQQLEQDFLVGYLHQRGTGHSTPSPDPEQSLANNVQDVDRVIEQLRQTYGEERIFLIGHSWGGMLAGAYAVTHPEKIRKLVLMSTALDFNLLLEDTYRNDLTWAREVGDAKAITELSALSRPFDTPDHFGTILSWADRAGGIAKDFDLEGFLQGHRVDQDYPGWRSQQQQANASLIPEMLNLELSGSFDRLTIPVLFVSGAADTIVREVTMRRAFEHYRGPKEYLRLEHSHHLPFIDEPMELTTALRRFFVQ